MSEDKQLVNDEEQMETTENALDPRMKDPGFWREIWEQVRLVWLLLRDSDVPIYLKLLPLAAVIYVIFPVDLIPDFVVPLGQIDDLTAVLLGAKMFIEMAPQDIVNRHIRAMRMQYGSASLNDVEPSDKEIDASIIIEGDYHQVDDQE
ncbi:MAG: DUF1232 domain-containing protein [Candidatus Promineifilaceae bacterium]